MPNVEPSISSCPSDSPADAGDGAAASGVVEQAPGPPPGSGIVTIGSAPHRVVLLPDAVAPGRALPDVFLGLVFALIGGAGFAALSRIVGVTVWSSTAGVVGVVGMCLAAVFWHRAFRIRSARHEIAELGDRIAVREVWRGRVLQDERFRRSELERLEVRQNEDSCLVEIEFSGRVVELGRGLSETECSWLVGTLNDWSGVK